MDDLTVGHVSGFIALAVFVVQLLVPLSISFILSGALGDDNTALTWSVAGRTIQSSPWPAILRAETAATRRVRKDIVFLTYIASLMFILVTAASIITPFGLYDVLIPGDEILMEFRYIKDTSPFGYGTPQRSSLGFSRKCGAWLPATCPGSDTVVIYSENDTTQTADLPFSYNTRIPQSLVDLYTSGTSGNNTTVSSIFDIEWRQYFSTQDDRINNGSRYIVGSFRHMQTLVLNDAVEPVEGLLVDTKNGGIGFRYHAIPASFKHGAEWTEDILFVEPETQCVNTNLTLDFTIKALTDTGFAADSTYIEDLVLTDRGGFANLIKKYPYYNRSDIQDNADLRGRAYKAAWWTNAMTMVYFNVTNPNPDAFSYLNSSIGKSFPLGPGKGLSFATDALTTSPYWDAFLYTSWYSSLNDTKPPNPFQIGPANYTAPSILCSGAGGPDIANISNIAVVCGLVYGAPRRQDGNTSLTFDEGTMWTIPLYSCASAVKATIKSVDLQINGTLGLQSLSVVRIRNKVYENDNAKPLWGVENSGMTLASGPPLWGIIAPSFEGRQNLSTVRKESLYLPGHSFLDALSKFPTGQNLPGVDFYTKAMGSAYNIGPNTVSIGGGTMPDYSGRSNMAMYAKWQEHSRTENTTSKILDLIWTDLAASAVMGTKGVLGPWKNGPIFESVRIPVRPIVQRVKCHYSFTILAFIVLVLWLLITAVTLISWAIGGSNIATMRRHIHQTSIGRVLTALLYPQECDLTTEEKNWVHKVGTRYIDLSAASPAICIVEDRQEEGERPGITQISQTVQEGDGILHAGRKDNIGSSQSAVDVQDTEVEQGNMRTVG